MIYHPIYIKSNMIHNIQSGVAVMQLLFVENAQKDAYSFVLVLCFKTLVQGLFEPRGQPSTLTLVEW